MRVVQYTQTATIRQRQLANRSTGSRFAVNVSRYTGNLINHLSFDGNVYRKLICKTRRKYFASNCPGLLKMFSSQTQSKSTCLTRSRFARHLEYSASSYQIGVQDVVKSTRFDQLVPVKVDLLHRKSIWKALRKYSASNYEWGLEMFSNRLDSTRYS